MCNRTAAVSRLRQAIGILPLLAVLFSAGCGLTQSRYSVLLPTASPKAPISSPSLLQTSTISPTSIRLSPTLAFTLSPSPEPSLTPTPSLPTWLEKQETALLPEERLPADALSFNHYQLHVSIDLRSLKFEGTLTLHYKNGENIPLDCLYFRLLPNGGGSYGNGSLWVSNVQVNNQPVDTRLSLADTVLEVKLPAEIPPQGRAQIEMEFNGKVPSDFGGQAAYGLYNFTQGVLTLAGWYPVLAVYDENGWNLDPVSSIGDSLYSDTAFYTVEITANQDVVLAATGTDISDQQEMKKRAWRFVSGPARDFFIAASANFLLENISAGEIQVNSYFLPGSEAGGKDAAQIAAQSLEIFNRRFGFYPYREFDIIQTPLRNASGVEFPGIVLIGASLYDNPQGPSLPTTLAHETAHQWWYNLVGNDVFDEPWLDEALATFSTALYFQEISGNEVYENIYESWQRTHDRLIEAGKDEPVTRELAYFERGDNARYYGAVVHIKGALFFHELCREIGDEAFFQAIQNYYATHRYRIVHGSDLLAEFEQASERELDDFFNQWLYNKP